MAPAKKNPKKKRPRSTNGCLIISLLLAILVLLSLGATFYFLFLRPGPVSPPPPAVRPAPVRPPSAPAPPPPATLPPQAAIPAPAAPETPPTPPPEAERPPVVGQPPRLAIIIDDIGNNRPVAEQLIALDLPLSFSVLPFTVNADHLASLAAARGRDVMLHLPMEAIDSRLSPGPGALMLSMSKETMLATLNRDLGTPYRPIGVNNHMGSRFTENQTDMRVVLEALKERGLFFVDSETSAKSVAYRTAKELGVKTARRDIFLDNTPQVTSILAQIGKAIIFAKRHGQAIAIGHPRPTTLEALRSALPRLKTEVRMVPVHELVE